jgi:hypothetical protein
MPGGRNREYKADLPTEGVLSTRPHPRRASSRKEGGSSGRATPRQRQEARTGASTVCAWHLVTGGIYAADCTAMRLGCAAAVFGICTSRVAYLSPADNVSRPLPCRLRRLNQPVLSPPNWFSTPRSTLMSSIGAHASCSTPRSSTGILF